jgi:hypothetical protein
LLLLACVQVKVCLLALDLEDTPLVCDIFSTLFDAVK